MLRDIEAVFPCSSGGETSYFANAIVKDMGVDGFIQWTNDHIGRVSCLVQTTTAATDARHPVTFLTMSDSNAIPVSPAEFQRLATACLTSARLIIDFQLQGWNHRIWREELEKSLPARLLQPLDDLRSANEARDAASADLHLAKQGKCVAGTPQGRRSLEAAQKRFARATEKCRLAGVAANATQPARVEAANILIARRMRILGQDFRALRTKYQCAYEQHSLALAGLDASPAQVGHWSGASACEVLARIADDVVRLRDLDDAPTPDHQAVYELSKKFQDLDPPAWEKLGIAVRKEVARLARSTTPSMQPADGRTASSPTEVATVNEPPAKRPKGAIDDTPPRPKPEAIDGTAKKCLLDALAAAKDAITPYVPTRADIASAVSKALNYKIAVESLFGTKATGKGREPRYPDFIQLWQETQRHSRASRPRKQR